MSSSLLGKPKGRRTFRCEEISMMSFEYNWREWTGTGHIWLRKWNKAGRCENENDHWVSVKGSEFLTGMKKCW